MVTVKIILDRRSKKKDGTSPLKLRFIYHGQTYHSALGYGLLAKDWDEAGQKVKPSCKTVGMSVTRFNKWLVSEKQNALSVITRLEDEGQLDRLSFKQIKQQVTGKQTGLMVLAYGQQVIAAMRQAEQHGNARVYDTMLRSVRTFAKGKDFPFKQLSFSWLKRYEGWYLAKGNSINGLGVSLRTLRALFNRAIKEKRISKDYYPFDEYRIKKESTRKRAISLEDIKKLKAFTPQTERQTRAQHYFLISFYLMGASFVDIAFLKGSNIVSGRIEYKRRKTGRLHSIALSLSLQTLLDIYGESKGKDDFILNVIKSEDPEQQLVNVRDALRRYNRSLKEIGLLCEIEAPLTSYVSRHSYATIAKYKGIPTAVISEALGHASEEVTQIYLDSFDKEVLDKYHQMVIE